MDLYIRNGNEYAIYKDLTFMHVRFMETGLFSKSQSMHIDVNNGAINRYQRHDFTIKDVNRSWVKETLDKIASHIDEDLTFFVDFKNAQCIIQGDYDESLNVSFPESEEEKKANEAAAEAEAKKMEKEIKDATANAAS